ncbi:hypothetical protein ACP4OV_011046 [Aristida adscensionis]
MVRSYPRRRDRALTSILDDTSSMAAAADRLSALPDAVLQRILSFAPAKEAAATAALSRRWRPLWLRSGALNLDTRSYDAAHGHHFAWPERDAAFARAAAAALAAHTRAAAAAAHPITKLTVFVEAPHYWRCRSFLNGEAGSKEEDDLLHAVLSHPAAQQLQELSVRAHALDHCDSCDPCPSAWTWTPRPTAGAATNLRVMDLSLCELVDPCAAGGAAAAMRCLEVLRLRECTLSPEYLEGMLRAAPGLTTLYLESAYFRSSSSNADDHHHDYDEERHDHVRLPCPALTALALIDCCVRNGSIELDAPRLRSFRYSGGLVPLATASPTPELTRVDLHIWELKIPSWRELVGSFCRDLRHARALKLRVFDVTDGDDDDKDDDGSQPPMTFPHLERVEFEGRCSDSDEAVSSIITTLLRCCPVVRELDLKVVVYRSRLPRNLISLERRHGFQRSLERFRRRHQPVEILDNDGNEAARRIWELLAMGGRPFDCLKSHLRRLVLQIDREWSDLFKLQVAKFFVQNAMVLEEMYIDDGNQYLFHHVSHKAAEWRAENMERTQSENTVQLKIYDLTRDEE